MESDRKELMLRGSNSLPSHTGTGMPMEVEVALQGLQQALDAGVSVAKAREDGKTARAMILAQKEVRIFAVEAETKRGMEQDGYLHERRMTLIQFIGNLLTQSDRMPTPEILSAAQVLLQALREET